MDKLLDIVTQSRVPDYETFSSSVSQSRRVISFQQDKSFREYSILSLFVPTWLLFATSSVFPLRPKVQLEWNNHPLFILAAQRRVFSVHSMLVKVLLFQLKHCIKFIFPRSLSLLILIFFTNVSCFFPPLSPPYFLTHDCTLRLAGFIHFLCWPLGKTVHK